MDRRTLQPVLLVGVGLLLLANPFWLVPHEGDPLYTYERSEVVVENGTFAYHGKEVGPFDNENDLTPVACIDHDTNHLRACALDAHLVTDGPITVPRTVAGETDLHFVRVEDAYYRRIRRVDDSDDPATVTLDVERVPPRTVLAESAVNLSDVSRVPPDAGVRMRVLVTGEPETSFTDLSDHALGTVYRRNGSYYVVVRTGATVVDHGPLLHPLRYEVPRYGLVGIGAVLLLGGALLYSPRTRGP